MVGRKRPAAGMTGVALLLLMAALVAYLWSVRESVISETTVGAGVPSWREVTDEELLR